MKKLIFSLAFAASLMASSDGAEKKPLDGEVEIKGFLATQWCIDNSYLKECPAESAFTSPYVIYVHSDLKYYFVDIADVPKHEIDEGFGKNNVSVIGKLTGETIKARAYKAPPPEGKSFFKGCL
jgi:hypothetical protein